MQVNRLHPYEDSRVVFLTETTKLSSNSFKAYTIFYEDVSFDLRTSLSGEFMENGYLKVCHELKDMSYKIGKNKTYRLMKENRLLLPPPQKAKREYVQFTQPLSSEPFEKIEMDIKFIYIRGQHKNALLDTFTPFTFGMGASIFHPLSNSCRPF